MSLLTHDYNDLNIILDQREHAGRAEKITSVALNAALTMEEIKEIAKEYLADYPSDEKGTAHQRGGTNTWSTSSTPKIDYSKTRLVQRAPKGRRSALVYKCVCAFGPDERPR